MSSFKVFVASVGGEDVDWQFRKERFSAEYGAGRGLLPGQVITMTAPDVREYTIEGIGINPVEEVVACLLEWDHNGPKSSPLNQAIGLASTGDLGLRLR